MKRIWYGFGVRVSLFSLLAPVNNVRPALGLSSLDSKGRHRDSTEPDRHRHGGARLRHQPAGRHQPPVRRRAERPACESFRTAACCRALRSTSETSCPIRGTGPLNPANANDERGFLGLAFHPGFNNPASLGYRTLYTYTSEALGAGADLPGPQRRHAELQEPDLPNGRCRRPIPNVVDPTSRREIISFGKNAGNHNGGTIAFGPDGYLYLAIGDGGNANDVGASHIEPGGNAQNLTTPLGKMIRIDPLNPSLTTGSPDPASTNGQYRIPTTNPFTGAGELREIYAFGFRNPYRFAFDPLNGDLILADVGQNNIEEINRVTIGGNYGWAVKEGEFLFNRTTGTIGRLRPAIAARASPRA